MTMQAAKPKRDKKKLIFLLIVPILLLVVGFTIFKDLFFKPAAPENNNQQLATGVPELKNDFVDSLSKADLYSNLKTKQEKEAQGKAVFDDIGNLNTELNPGSQPQQHKENLQARLKEEVVPPVYNDPPAPRFNRQSYSTDNSSDNKTSYETNAANPTENGFNSIVLPNGVKKDETTNAYANYGTSAAYQESNISVLAETDGKQKIFPGGSLKLILKDELKINGITLSAGTKVTGITRFSASRVDVDVRSINVNNKIVYVNLKAFDLDGVEGLAMKEKDVAKMGKNVYTDEIDRLETGIGTQVPGYAGQVVGSIVRSIGRNRKEKSSEISVPAKYQVILKN